MCHVAALAVYQRRRRDTPYRTLSSSIDYVYTSILHVFVVVVAVAVASELRASRDCHISGLTLCRES